jgi:UDP-glucuronate 4-epimerase
LVTGAAGFIGSHLCEKLASLGHDVTGLDNFNSYYDPALKQMNAADLAQIGIGVLNKDLNSNLSGVFSQAFDYIFHLAAQPGISAETSLQEYVSNNIFATQNLLQAVQAGAPGTRCFVNIATSSVYGGEATVAEDASPQPISFYGITKWAAEQLVLSCHREGKLPGCSIRLYSVYGPRERPEKLYTKLIDNLYHDRPFPLFEGSLHHERSFTYVGDIVSGLAAIVGREHLVAGEIINLGTDEVNTTAEGIRAVEQIMDKKLTVEHKPARPGDQLRTAAVISKARDLLGYEPQTSLYDGLALQVAWYLKKFGKSA